jgi:hypothetical protein
MSALVRQSRPISCKTGNFSPVPPGKPPVAWHLAHDGESVFRHACKMGLEGIVSKRLGSRYRSGRSRDWLKMKNPAAPAVKREAEEDWGREK